MVGWDDQRRRTIMRRDSIIRLLKEHQEELGRFDVEALAVFGSVARGESESWSDVDILVEFEGRATFNRYMDLKFFLEDLLGCQVDLVTRKALRPRMRPSVEKEAVYVT
jgi:hypothetical protein